MSDDEIVSPSTLLSPCAFTHSLWLLCVAGSACLFDAINNKGSGFGQKAGTQHFRTTFLPPEEDMEEVVQRLSAFHTAFLSKYGGL